MKLQFVQSIGQFQASHNLTLYTIRAIVNGIELQYMNYRTGDTQTLVFATAAQAIECAESIAAKESDTEGNNNE